MQRFTLSIDDELAERFDAYLTEHGYANRSNASATFSAITSPVRT